MSPNCVDQEVAYGDSSSSRGCLVLQSLHLFKLKRKLVIPDEFVCSNEPTMEKGGAAAASEGGGVEIMPALPELVLGDNTSILDHATMKFCALSASDSASKDTFQPAADVSFELVASWLVGAKAKLPDLNHEFSFDVTEMLNGCEFDLWKRTNWSEKYCIYRIISFYICWIVLQ